MFRVATDICVTSRLVRLETATRLFERPELLTAQEHDHQGIHDTSILSLFFLNRSGNHEVRCLIFGRNPVRKISNFVQPLQERVAIKFCNQTISVTQSPGLAMFYGKLISQDCTFKDGGVAMAEGLINNPHQGPCAIVINGPSLCFDRKGCEKLKVALAVNTNVIFFVIGQNVKQDADLVDLIYAIKTSCFLLELNVSSTLSAENWRLLVDCLRNNSSIETFRTTHEARVTRGHELVQALSSNKVITKVFLPQNSLSAQDKTQLLDITSLNKSRAEPPSPNSDVETNSAAVPLLCCRKHYKSGTSAR